MKESRVSFLPPLVEKDSTNFVLQEGVPIKPPQPNREVSILTSVLMLMLHCWWWSWYDDGDDILWWGDDDYNVYNRMFLWHHEVDEDDIMRLIMMTSLGWWWYHEVDDDDIVRLMMISRSWWWWHHQLDDNDDMIITSSCWWW